MCEWGVSLGWATRRMRMQQGEWVLWLKRAHRELWREREREETDFVTVNCISTTQAAVTSHSIADAVTSTATATARPDAAWLCPSNTVRAPARSCSSVDRVQSSAQLAEQPVSDLNAWRQQVRVLDVGRGRWWATSNSMRCDATLLLHF